MFSLNLDIGTFVTDRQLIIIKSSWTTKAQLMRRGTHNSGACLKAQ